MTTLWERWVEVARIASSDPSAMIPCPVCAQANLSILDVAPYPETGVFERQLECPNCHARNAMRMHRKPAPPSDSGRDG